MTSPRRRSLQLPLSAQRQRHVFRRRRHPPRWRQFGVGLLFMALGAAMLFGLVQLPERLDTVLLLSNALAQLISGVRALLLGLLQLFGVVLVVLVALLALLLLVGGGVRLVRALMPRPRSPRPS
ncbi:MAG: hypothetical protein QM522_05575 [Chitinophagaceae bacterium]|nr:hypothetical protein [Chitinophagaceae bacterium]